MFKRSPNRPGGKPKVGGLRAFTGRALVLGREQKTTQAVRRATQTLVTNPLARVARPSRGETNSEAFDIRNQVRPACPRSSHSKQLKFIVAASERWSTKQDDVAEYLLAELKKNFLFTELGSSQLQALIEAFEQFPAPAGTCIIKEGEPGDYFYILYKGKVTYEIEGKAVGSAQANDGSDTPNSFGELALFFSAPRAASVMAETDCVLYRLDQENFRLIAEHQILQDDEQRMTLVKQLPVLQDLDETSLANLVSAMTSQRFRNGHVLFEKGDLVQDFLIVQAGHLQATDVQCGDTAYQDEVIGPNQSRNYFGWTATVQDEPVVARIEAITDCYVLSINGETFRRVVGQQDEALAHLQNTRQLQDVAVFRDSCLTREQVETLVAVMLPCQYYRHQTTVIQEGSTIDAAITFVRKGKVKIESKMDKYTKLLEVGGYYGQEWILVDQNKDVNDDLALSVESRFTVTTEPHTELQVLMLEDIRQVVNTSLLGLGKPAHVSVLDDTLRLEDLKRHSMVGAGTFGQVWSASCVTPGSPTQTLRVFALKVQSKYQLIESGQVEGVVAEVNIMKSLKSPFIIRLYATFQDPQRVFMLTSFLQGGELNSLMDQPMEDAVAAFYAAGILEGLTYMHQRHIIHRDLKPENVMISSNGYPVLIDLGFAKYVAEKTYTFCGTPMYIAPEVIQYKGHDKCADYWSWACMVFEMVTGKYPFYEHDMAELELFNKIINGQFKIYGFMSYEARLLFISLFVPDPSKRLGASANGWQDLANLPFFDCIDFKSLGRQTLPAPWVPELHSPLDSCNFSGVKPDMADKMNEDEMTIDDELQAMFYAFGKVSMDAA